MLLIAGGGVFGGVTRFPALRGAEPEEIHHNGPKQGVTKWGKQEIGSR